MTKQQEYLELLAQRYAGYWALPIESARRIVGAVAVTADKDRLQHLKELQQRHWSLGGG